MFSWIEEALERSDFRKPGAKLIVLPELCVTGYVSPDGDFDLSRFAEETPGNTTARFAALAEKFQIHLLHPLLERTRTGIYNTAMLLDPRGREVVRYRKRHPWYPETWATPGDAPFPLFDLLGIRTTLAICFDIHFLEEEARSVLREASLVLFPSAWVEKEDSRLPMLRALAREYDLTIVNANWGEGVPQIAGQGNSCIVSPTRMTLERASLSSDVLES